MAKNRQHSRQELLLTDSEYNLVIAAVTISGKTFKEWLRQAALSAAKESIGVARQKVEETTK